eukprot:TRINITY_DN1591_c0_g1_i1.p1 TRINITY_DN1591_c0_g1~~TRINITY_DN1591_c0_g1_i1.p1  ORF type:complete len:171 (+),score=26.15 TRINITY_DN1591_c0_g1_i1:45-515(+)
MTVCEKCDKSRDLNACGNCESVFYCSVACQKSDWRHHKPLCPLAAAARQQGWTKKVISEGTGESPTSGSNVFVHYVGTLLNGTPFDSSRDRDRMFDFPLGKGRVIRGWDEGVATMKIGERSTFVLSPSYAYGERGAPPTIPPNATLVFDVELFAFE